MSLWPHKCSSYWIVYLKKEEMCLVPGVTSQLIVRRERGRGENSSVGKLMGLLLLVAAVCPRAGWSAAPRPSLPPTQLGWSRGCRLGWGARGDLVKTRGYSTMLQMCEKRVLKKGWELQFLLTWEFASLVAYDVLYELEIIGRNPGLTIVHVNIWEILNELYRNKSSSMKMFTPGD